MSKLMLIDAAHPEETRVAIVNNGQVDDFDFETTGHEQLRGNIYLAKITRVEPSLQAAFVEYGGNRHGFLAFSEIHPDYYQLPQEDREALLREAAEAAAEAEADEDDEGVDLEEDLDDHHDDDDDDTDSDDDDAEDEADASADDSEEETDAENSEGDDTDEAAKPKPKAKAAANGRNNRKRSSRPHISKRYKIQEVIRRRQVMLVQVVKEERGNKGAALTTHLSLAGRYSVLMPNTPRGGGISRKIANGADRKRLKSIVADLNVPDGMGLIVRTAGAKRTKTEIKRDYDYLSKLWETIVEKTLSSDAPVLINAEGGLVHRAMRDMFDKDVEEVLVQGADAYREAKDLANLIMPGQATKVQPWKEDDPLFVAEGAQEQLDSIYSPTVQLKSGGYLVINQAEALVAIDVNSGKSTRERNIELTATRTNLEAAEEACRQMRLRDLAGLVVIDFIDMDENKNNRAVEKKLKDCLKVDRARVQHGRISQFGLMEISRQRRRQGVLQATSDPCSACNGTGRRRSIPSAALQLIRAIEARVSSGGLKSVTVKAPTDVALYLLNNKREALMEIENEAGFAISVHSSDDLLPGDFTIDAERDPNSKPKRKRKPRSLSKPSRPAKSDTESDDDSDTESNTNGDESTDDDEQPKKRRRRRGGRGRKRGGSDQSSENTETETTDPETSDDDSANSDADSNDEAPEVELDEDGQPKKRRRRGRRGGRRRRKNNPETADSSNEESTGSEDASNDGPSATGADTSAPKEDVKAASSDSSEVEADIPASEDEAPKPKRRRRRPAKAASEDAPAAADASPAPEAISEPAPEAPEEPKAETKAADKADAPVKKKAPAKPRKPRAKPAAKAAPKPEPEPAKEPEAAADDSKRKGWWSRARGK